MNGQREAPKVSVCVIAYNHERHIRTCLESILQQDTGFRYEIIVADDCSIDKTRLVIDELVRKHPDVIKCIFQESNTGGAKNYLDVHAAAKGEYIAHIDGDDAMLPGKLRIQAAFLDANPGCTAVFHGMAVIRNECPTDTTIASYASRSIIYTIEQLLLLSRPFYHSSKMYRASAAHWKDAELFGYDFYMNIINALNGPVAYLSEVLGHYRLGNTSLSGTRSNYVTRVALNNKAFELAERAGVDWRTVATARSNMYFRNALGALRRGYSDFFQAYIVESRRFPKRSVGRSIVYHLRQHEYLLLRLLQIFDGVRGLSTVVNRAFVWCLAASRLRSPVNRTHGGNVGA